MNPAPNTTLILLAKLGILGILLVGMLVLVGLGKVEWKDAVNGAAMLGGSLIVALGIKAGALTTAANQDDEKKP